VQTTHTAISNAQSRMDVRWRVVLMAHDRIGDDTLPLTHEFLSLMLGVRRAGVTDALNALRSRKSFVPAGENHGARPREWSARRGRHTARRKQSIATDWVRGVDP